MSIAVILTSVVGTASTCVGILVGWQSYRKSKYEADKLKKASTAVEAPAPASSTDALIGTLSIISKQLGEYKTEVDESRVTVITLRTSLDDCLRNKEGGQHNGTVA